MEQTERISSDQEKERLCPVCGKEFIVTENDSLNKFCSPDCEERYLLELRRNVMTMLEHREEGHLLELRRTITSMIEINKNKATQNTVFKILQDEFKNLLAMSDNLIERHFNTKQYDDDFRLELVQALNKTLNSYIKEIKDHASVSLH